MSVSQIASQRILMNESNNGKPKWELRPATKRCRASAATEENAAGEGDLSRSMWKYRLAAEVFPWHIGLLDWVNRNALLRKWIAEQRGRIPTFKLLHDFYRYVHDEVGGGTAIDFLEFGVCAGSSITFWSQMNRNPQSRFIGFDSFEGLPEDWTRNYPKDTLSTGGWVPEIDDERVSFVKGWFQNTLPSFLDGFAPRSRLVAHRDSDLYSSTLFTLASLNALLVPGVALILDDFPIGTHVFHAFADYKSAFMRSAHPVAMTSDYASQGAVRLRGHTRLRGTGHGEMSPSFGGPT